MSSPPEAHRSHDPPVVRAETLLPAKRAVKPRELWLRGGFDQASIGLAIIDREGQIRLVNGAFTNLSGLPKSKVVGTRLPDLLEPPSSEVVQQWCLAPVQPATFEVTVQRASASPLEAVLLVSPLSGGGATGHTLVQLVPAALSPTTREELARFHGVIDHIDDLIASWPTPS